MSDPAPVSRTRMVIAHVLVVLGAIVAAIALAAGYVRYQLFDQDTFGQTASDLIADDTIRDQVAASLVDQLFANVNVRADFEQRLPQDQQYLAGTLAVAARQVADRAAPELLSRPRIQQLWRTAALTAQTRLEQVLDDDLRAVQTENGYVVLDLRSVLAQLSNEVAVVGNLADRLPPDAGQIRLLKADQLETAQDVTQIFKTVAPWVWLVPFVLWAIAIWLARGRRRVELRAVAWALVVAGLLVLVGRAVGGRYVVGALSDTASSEDAARSAWSIVTDLLSDGAWTAILVGVVALVGVWLAGDTRSGTAARRRLAPILARWEYAYGIAAVLLLLLVWWGPTAQTRRPLQVLFGAVLLGVGVEALRRVTRREFPEASAVLPGEAFRGIFRRDSERAPAPAANHVDELERLARLHDAGVLTDDELAAEKTRVISSTP
jgi:hypothetical protein